MSPKAKKLILSVVEAIVKEEVERLTRVQEIEPELTPDDFLALLRENEGRPTEAPRPQPARRVNRVPEPNPELLDELAHLDRTRRMKGTEIPVIGG